MKQNYNQKSLLLERSSFEIMMLNNFLFELWYTYLMKQLPLPWFSTWYKSLLCIHSLHLAWLLSEVCFQHLWLLLDPLFRCNRRWRCCMNQLGSQLDFKLWKMYLHSKRYQRSLCLLRTISLSDLAEEPFW